MLTAVWKDIGKILTKKYTVSPLWNLSLYHVAKHFNVKMEVAAKVPLISQTCSQI